MRPPHTSKAVIVLLALAVAMLSLTAAVAVAHGGKQRIKVPKLKPVPKVVKVKSTKKPPKTVKFRGQPMPGGITTGTGTATGGAGDILIPGIPGYLWRDGCGPTAVGMVVGYYDGNGWPDLIPGDATSETVAVDQAMCSHGTADQPASYEDYALPKETSAGQLLTDKSQTGDAHVSDCVADFMHTSWSADGVAYGGSYSSMVGPGFVNYVKAKYPGCTPTAATLSGTNLTWEKVKVELNAGRPMVFLVDSSGDGMTDHFVTIVGYRESNGYAEYGCWDTWNAGLIRWQRFRAMSSSYQWGVWGGFTFSLGGGTTTTPTPTPTPTDTATPTPVADTTAPVTTPTGLDAAWHSTSVGVSFTATDDVSGVAYTEYRLDGAAWTRGASVTIAVSKRVATAAVHTLEYRSVDVAGNVETSGFGQVKIDSIKPATASNADGVTHAGSFTLVLSPKDADSGVKASYISVDGKAYAPANSVTISGAGRHTVKFYSVDNAGNTEGAKSLAVRIG